MFSARRIFPKSEKLDSYQEQIRPILYTKQEMKIENL